jgi:hypothetical protein
MRYLVRSDVGVYAACRRRGVDCPTIEPSVRCVVLYDVPESLIADIDSIDASHTEFLLLGEPPTSADAMLAYAEACHRPARVSWWDGFISQFKRQS